MHILYVSSFLILTCTTQLFCARNKPFEDLNKFAKALDMEIKFKPTMDRDAFNDAIQPLESYFEVSCTQTIIPEELDLTTTDTLRNEENRKIFMEACRQAEKIIEEKSTPTSPRPRTR